jgi:hypothetical protein
MNSHVLHPATIQLLWLQSRGRRRRIWRRFGEPRRLILSVVACLLAGVWLGNAALTVWLREAGSPVTLRALLSLGLVLYATWHFSKAAFFRPESPFDWTPAERDQLAAMPLLPRDLVTYQVASVTVTTILKTGLLMLLLLPDLRSLSLGFAGLLLAMLALEMLRLAIDIATWGMGRAAYLTYRTIVVAGLVAAGFAIGTVVTRDQLLAQINLGDGLLDRLLEILVHLNTKVFGIVALPFRPLVDLILAEGVTAANVQLAVVAAAVVAGMAVAVIGLYATLVRRVARRERDSYCPAARVPVESSSGEPRRPLRISLHLIPRCRGAGPLAWRQLVGAGRHWGSLLTAMIAPAILACVPFFVINDPRVAFVSTTGALAFYTFLLLPTALRFDFHRDFERLAVLKGLPISPAAAVVGQTFAPVLIATLFQAGVLAAAVVARSLPPQFLVAAMLVMTPLNVFVFALDNLIFLLYPHRMQQEGLEIFLRTMLTFTGKGVLFTAGLAAVAGWGFSAAALTHSLAAWSGGRVDAYAIFATGLIAGPILLALLTLCALCLTYRRLDPIEDTAG